MLALLVMAGLNLLISLLLLARTFLRWEEDTPAETNAIGFRYRPQKEDDEDGC